MTRPQGSATDKLDDADYPAYTIGTAANLLGVQPCGSRAAAQNLALPHVTSDVVLAIDGDATLNAPAVALMVDTISAAPSGSTVIVRWLYNRHD